MNTSTFFTVETRRPFHIEEIVNTSFMIMTIFIDDLHHRILLWFTFAYRHYDHLIKYYIKEEKAKM